MINARKILKDIITTIDTTLYINTVEPIIVGGAIVQYKLYTCDTLYLRKDKSIVWGGDSFVIADVVLNEYVLITATSEIAEPYPMTATTYPLYFYSAKLRDASLERNEKDFIQSREVPFVWIREPYQHSTIDEFQSFREYSLEMYFLDDSLMVGEGVGIGNSWDTETHHKEVIEPMQNLYYNRVKTAFDKNKKFIIDWQNENVRGLPLVQESENKNLFDEKLSGIEVRLDMKFSISGCKC